LIHKSPPLKIQVNVLSLFDQNDPDTELSEDILNYLYKYCLKRIYGCLKCAFRVSKIVGPLQKIGNIQPIDSADMPGEKPKNHTLNGEVFGN